MYEDEYKEDEAVEGEEEDEEEKNEEEQAEGEQDTTGQDTLVQSSAESQAQPESTLDGVENPFPGVAPAVAADAAAQQQGQQPAKPQNDAEFTQMLDAAHPELKDPKLSNEQKAKIIADYATEIGYNGTPNATEAPGTQALTTSYYNSINIDPNKTYGQTNSKPGYNYSYDAKQLQHDVNRAIFDYNKKIANGTIPGKTAADYIKPLKEDGMYGSKTKEAITALSQAGYNVTNLPASVGGNSTPAPAQPSANTASEETTTAPTTSTAPRARDSSNDIDMARAEQRAGQKALREAEAEAARQKAIQDAINGNNNLPEDAPPMQVSNGNNSNQNLGQALSVLSLETGAQAPQELNPDAAELEAAYQANNGGQVYGQPRNGSVPSRYSDADDLIAEYNQEMARNGESDRYDARFFAEQGNNDMSPDATWSRFFEQDIASGLTPEQIMDKARSENSYEARQYANWVLQNGQNYEPPTPEYTVYDEPIGPMMPEPTGVYGTPGNRGVPNRYQAELEQMQEPQGEVYGTPRNGSVPERFTPEPERQSMTGNSMSEALENRQPDRTMPRGYATPANESLAGNSYSAALERAIVPPDTNIFRQELEDLEREMSSDDVQSSGMASTPRQLTRAEGVSQVGDSMSRALADNQAQPDTNIFREDAVPVISPERENQYKTLFNNEMNALSQMYPGASFNQLYDYLRLFYEQNGDTDTEYYRWFNSFL